MLNLEIDFKTGKEMIMASGNMLDICSEFCHAFLTICRRLDESDRPEGAAIARRMRISASAALRSDVLYEDFKNSEHPDAICIVSIKEAAET